MGKFSTTLLIISSSILMSACSKVNFAPTNAEDPTGQQVVDVTPTPPPVKPPPVVECRKDQVKITRPVRVLFIVDQSGSNVNGPFDEPSTPTDPVKKFRGDVMSQFYLSNRSKPNLSWGLTVFNNDYATNLMTDASNRTVPFSTVPNDFNVAFNRFMNRSDSGMTPYKAALSLSKEMITKDLKTAPQYVSYLVVFLTDGYPTDYCSSGVAQAACPGKIMEGKIDADVKAVADVSKTNIQFSTVYYGLPDTDAAKRLSRMAKIGGGSFVDTNTTRDVRLDDILEVEKEICVNKN